MGDHPVAGLSARALGATRLLSILIVLSEGASLRADVAPTLQGPRDLTELSLAELAEVKVITVQKRPEALKDTPAAVTVITGDEVEASGATSIPALLRRAPGVHVSQLDASQWAIGIRGFTNTVARSQLAIQDGRSLYTPLFAGTYWDVQNPFLEDVERIEIIRGPGGTLWGANAVNGIVNILTKSSRDTRGGLLVLGGGNQERGFGRARFGGGWGRATTYRAYASYFNRAAESEPDAGEYDAWHMSQGGFRMDWAPRASDAVVVQGDVYSGSAGRKATFATFTPPYLETVVGDAELTGGNVRARWSRAFSESRDVTVQAYYDRTGRDEASLSEDRDTFDVEGQYRAAVGGRHVFVAGLGYRISDGRTTSVPTLAFVPPDRTDHLFSGFLEDTFAIVPERLRLTVGTKVERNDYSDFELQPSGRLVFSAGPRHSFWAAVTRPVRTPTRFDRDLVLNLPVAAGTPAFVRLLGDEGFETERSTVYELGYRAQVSPRLSVDVTAFHNRYPNLVGYEGGAPFADKGLLILPLRAANGTHGRVNGAEISADVRLVDHWLLRGAYSYLDMQLESAAEGADDAEGSSPRHQAYVSSTTTLPGRLTVAAFYRWVARLPFQDVPAYSELDLRLQWRASDRVDLSVNGENLLHERHAEFGSGTIGGGGGGQVTMRRSVHAKAAIRW
jgi:iron complex outermembrane recepter protein